MFRIIKIVILVILAFVALNYIKNLRPTSSTTDFDPQTATYDVENAKYFGNLAKGDLNADGTDDVGFLITSDGGGSGTFYYAVAALNKNGTYTTTNTIFLGDRIAPQTTEIKNGELIINYADRKPTDPMVTPPSVNISKYLKVSEENLVEVVK